jgi:hypothetical protein
LFEDRDLNIGEPDHMLRAHIAVTSCNYFSLLGAHPVIGRAFSPGDHSTAVISYQLWQELYGGSKQVRGRSAATEAQVADGRDAACAPLSTIRTGGTRKECLPLADGRRPFDSSHHLRSFVESDVGPNG